jgi:hypothetical protein
MCIYLIKPLKKIMVFTCDLTIMHNMVLTENSKKWLKLKKIER